MGVDIYIGYFMLAKEDCWTRRKELAVGRRQARFMQLYGLNTDPVNRHICNELKAFLVCFLWGRCSFWIFFSSE